MRTWIAVALLVTLAACGSDPKPIAIEALAERVGCTEFRQDSAEDQTLSTRESGSCVIDGGDVGLFTFSSKEQAAAYDDAASVWEGMNDGAVTVKGELWRVTVYDAELADRVAKAAGGEVA